MDFKQLGGQELVTTFAMGLLAFCGAVSKGKQWRDPKTGEISWSLFFVGVATAIMLTAVVRAIGVHYGLEVWSQMAGAGIAGYIGPDPIIGLISKQLMKRFGLEDTQGGSNGPVAPKE